MDPQESPVLVGYMTPREIYYKDHTAGFATVSPQTGSRRIALRRKRSSVAMASTFIHELGHIKFPVEKPKEQPSKYLSWNFSELCANYYQLRYKAADKPWVREKIRNVKEELRDDGITGEQVARLDALARKRVGYEGRSIE